MSILIKGMEMPKDIEPGLVIEFADGIDGKRYARLWHYRHGGLTEWLETVPVPPHGRLIDADALAVHKFAGAEHDISIEDGGACYRRGWNDAIEAIMENAETIIGGE